MGFQQALGLAKNSDKERAWDFWQGDNPTNRLPANTASKVGSSV